MAAEREDLQYRGHRIVANDSGAMIYPDKHSIVGESIQANLKAAKSWVDQKYRNRHVNRREPHIGTVDDFLEAFTALPLGDHETAMLTAHKKAPGHRLTATQLSESAGWQDAGPANLHYGYLGRRVSEQLGLPLTENDGRAWTEALAEYDDDTNEWILYPEAVEALEKLNIG